MLSPEYIDTIPDYFVDLFQDLEAFVISDFAKKVAKAGTITSSAEWQAMRAKEIGMSMADLDKELKKVTKLSQKEIDGIVEEVAKTSLKNDSHLYESKNKLVPSLEDSETLQKYVQSAKEQTSGDLFNMTQSLGFARVINGKIEYLPTYEFYNKALDLAQFQVSTGILDYNKATQNAIKTIAESGLRWIDYESGVHNRIDVAVKRAVRTGVNQMSSKMNDYVVDDLGADYVEVTAHEGARPDHAEWQGRIFKVVGHDDKYPNLAEVTGLGTGGGLCGWNCRHNYYAFFPEFSTPTYSDKELKNIDNPPFEYKGKTYTHYEATQKQRQIETAIRKTENELIGYDASGNTKAFDTASIKLQRQKEAYRDFTKSANLKLQPERYEVNGFTRSIKRKSTIAGKKTVAKTTKSDIIKSKKKVEKVDS